MILKVSQKVNGCGWRRQIIIDFEKKTAKKGVFLFHSGDIDDLTSKQYKQYLEFLKYNDFEIMEG